MKKILFFILISNWICAQWSISNAERDALIGIYNVTNGNSWNRTWDLQQDPRNWYGIVVKNGRVLEINLKGNALKGTFPTNLATFSGLTKLDLSSNQLTGEVSQSISSLTSLVRLDISYNNLNGDPTSALSIFPQLQEASIGNNLFVINDINSLLQTNSTLQVLNLSNLGLTSVPAKISSYNKLLTLDLSNNNITSGYNQLRGLTSLQSLSLAGNQLTSIPSDILTLSRLLTLDLSNNNFTINFTGLNSFQNLEWLSLENNQLPQIPAELSQISNLYHLNLGKNQIKSGYSNLVHFKNLQQVYLNDNNIDGAIPSELLAIPQLMMLSLANNRIYGGLVSNLPPICDISNNKFSQEVITDYINTHQDLTDRLYYSPQRYDGIYDQVKGVIGESAKLTQSLSGDDYTFSWYKNLGEYTQVKTESYNINSVQESDYGLYTAEAFFVKKLSDYVVQLSMFREPIALVKELSTDESVLKDLKVYPNPTSQYLNILSNKYIVEQSIIYDLSGKQVMTTKQKQIDVSHLPSGTYMLNIKTSEGYKNFKFVKQ